MSAEISLTSLFLLPNAFSHLLESCVELPLCDECLYLLLGHLGIEGVRGGAWCVGTAASIQGSLVVLQGMGHLLSHQLTYPLSKGVR